ncbi:MAG: Hsp20/alpha crystallin family protein [Candidatus Cloacimonadales bacterium]|nr:Hsp20/alpha crystallin family protein [Candidatus Cloacimonadales bacterium]
MKVVPYNNRRNFYPMMSVFDKFVDDFFKPEDGQDNQRTMALDILEEDEKFLIEANLPGFKKEDVKISVNNNELVIEAKKDEKKEEKKGSYCRCERYQGSYRRVLSLSDQVDRDKIEAKFEDGVLILDIPKMEPVPAKEIKIG